MTSLGRARGGAPDISQAVQYAAIAQRRWVEYDLGDPRGACAMATEHPRIALDPTVLAGKPVIRGTRLSVEFIIGLLAKGWSEADILANYSGITHEDVIACLAYARDALSSERVFPSAA
jgi:uncharacterized protein (DUF433 family)